MTNKRGSMSELLFLFYLNRTTTEASFDHRLEHLCHLKEIGCWGHLCLPQVLTFTLLSSFGFTYVDLDFNFFSKLSRGENGELRVGVRRANRQQSSMPSSVISSHSMHLGVLATACHATQTRSMFTVYYKPRYKVTLLYGCNILGGVSSTLLLIDSVSV